MRGRDDRGQTSTAYLGTILLAGAIVAAIFGWRAHEAIAGGVDEAVCRVISVAGGDGGCEGSGGEPGDPGGGLTPREQAEAGDYVAIGDSFSSGEGAYDYDPETDTEQNACHRSANAYSEHVEDDFDFAGEVRIVTCSGARVSNVLETGQHGEPPQIEAVTEDSSLVTIGISGNDADWVPVIVDCLADEGCQGDEDTVRQRLEDAADRALEVYEQARERAGDDARIIAVGYPRFFPEEPTGDLFQVNIGCVQVPFAGERCAKRFGLSPEEQGYMNSLTRYFNDLLAERAAEAGVEFVDMTDAFDGHEFGTEDPYFNDLVLDPRWPGWDDLGGRDDVVEYLNDQIASETSHPNAAGQERMAELVTEQIENP